MAALDDIVGGIVFFITITVVAGSLSAGEFPAGAIGLPCSSCFWAYFSLRA
ncbi:hypothetical protein [Bacteroides salyersiae]|uniref:hypothetical protein n=1 Tax=Bacteroides salyersiae TaxID=291644 RepID=UPI001E52C517|nr:hypothetical protein [Bacteroides salyersiae]